MSVSPKEDEPAQLTPRLIKDSSRIDVDSLMNEFRHELGPLRWERYRDSLTHFLMGKLSRAELVRCLREYLGLGGVALKNHNTLVLSLLANACREPPPGTESRLAEWKETTRKSRHAGIDANDRLHREIMSLPVRERRRLKNITKETAIYLKNPLVPPPPPMLIAARQAMLPHIPYVQDRTHGVNGVNGSANGVNGSANGVNGGSTNSPISTTNSPISTTNSTNMNGSTVAQAAKEENPLMDPLLNLHPGRASGLLTWTQDIIQGLEAPLISETHELPGDSELATRMLSIALENGLLGGLGPGATDMMLLGLETYFRNTIDQLLALKHRKISSAEPLSTQDLCMFADERPTELGEPSLPLLRMRTYYLHDELTNENTEIGEEEKRNNPWDIESVRKRLKRNENEEMVLEEHRKGIELLEEL